MLFVRLRFVAMDAGVTGQNKSDRAPHVRVLLFGELLACKLFGDLSVLASRAVTRLARGTSQSSSRWPGITGRLTVARRVTFQATTVRAVFGGKNFERLGVFRFFPGQKLIEMA